MIIDTHAHLMFEQFNADLDDVLSRARQAGVQKMINVGCGVESSRQAVEMAAKYSDLYASVGMHPYEADLLDESILAEWERQIMENEKIVAIGECGLDYVKSTVDKEIQKRAFLMQLELARRTELPVIIHNRGADEDCLKILSDFNAANALRVNAVFHCYSSDANFARRVWHDGYYTSFTCNVTYSSSEELRKVVAEVPMDLFMVETDCPFLAPQDKRGERNEPSFVVDVVKTVAEVKKISFEEIARISSENALGLFLRMH